MKPTELALQEGSGSKGEWLVGVYRETVRPIDEISNALSRFLNLEPECGVIASFTREYGLLHWGYTHEGVSGDSESRQFYIPLDDFRQDQKVVRGFWQSRPGKGRMQALAQFTEWLTEQLAPSQKSVRSMTELWKAARPELRMQVKTLKSGALETQLVAGDLWQALCWMLLDKLAVRTNALGICRNENCKNERYFVVTRRGQKYCGADCSKLVADREYARRRRAKEARRKRGK